MTPTPPSSTNPFAGLTSSTGAKEVDRRSPSRFTPHRTEVEAPGPVVTRFERARADLLRAVGVRTVREFILSEPVRAARTLAAASRAGVTLTDTDIYARTPASEAGRYDAWPVSSLRGLSSSNAQKLGMAGVVTVGDLARAADDADAAIIERASDNGFAERPSAPVELLPGMVGAVANRVRYSTFVRELELRDLELTACEDCAQPLPLSPHGYGKPESPDAPKLIDIFTKQRCPVVQLGYICGHVQQWINLGTSLGEVVHSVALAPGESRNIAMVNWRRRQLTSLEEKTTTSEHITATFVQNRALHEVTHAVASEHQSGGSQTEANTAVTAAAFVGVGAAVGSLAFGVGGAVIGGAIGSAFEPGVGTVIGAGAGGVGGAAVGAAVGAAAGGLVYAGSSALGKIMAASDGDRSIVAEVHQNITLSTSQNASAVRSIWSTVVVEDTQAENVDATTSNITNYNHMHALNVEYYEILQRYLVRIELERVEPVMYLPFTFANFINLNYVRDYWDAIRPYIDDTEMQTQGDAYFVTEDVPEVPDDLPVPPMPTPPAQPTPPKLSGLMIDVLYDEFVIPNNFDLTVHIDGREIADDGSPDNVPGNERDGYGKGKRFKFSSIENAHLIDAVVLKLDQALDDMGIRFDVKFAIRVHAGKCEPGEDLAGVSIKSNGKLKADSSQKSFTFDWRPVDGFEAASDEEKKEYRRLLKERALIIAKNTMRQHAYEKLVQSIERFKQRLGRLLLRRRNFFTRVLLNAIEPEEVMQVFESLCFRTEGGSERVRLTDFAHTVPVAMYPGGFILKLKHGDRVIDHLRRVLDAAGKGVGEDLATMLSYGTKTAIAFDEPAERAAFTRAEEVYLPTAGLFAEAVLGRSNSAEYIDVERYFNWKDSPIPHQAPAINPVDTGSRFQDQNVQTTTPPSTLNVINPVGLPDPTGMTGVLQAIQNGNMFRDMSKATELAGIISSLSQLAGQMGQSASTMTGQAAQQAMQAATQIGQTAAGLASTMGTSAFQQAGAAFNTMGTMTGQGAMLNQAGKIDAAKQNAATPGGATGGGNSSGGGNGGSGSSSGGGSANGGGNGGGTGSSGGAGGVTGGAVQPNLTEETFRRLMGGSTVTASNTGNTSDSQQDGGLPGPEAWRDLILFRVPQDIVAAMASRDIHPQLIPAATSAEINLDYFPVEITKMPTVNGAQLTASQLFEYIRKNINQFMSEPLCTFEPAKPEDEPIWTSNNPRGAVLNIDLLGPDNAAVVCAESTSDHWIFSTVRTPLLDQGEHPVSGNRMFGFISTDASTTIFTRGADRATGFFDSLLSDQIFGGGAAVWSAFRVKLLEFVVEKGGEARLPRIFSFRTSWNSVVGKLNVPIDA